jgi:hypothetical protein
MQKFVVEMSLNPCYDPPGVLARLRTPADACCRFEKVSEKSRQGRYVYSSGCFRGRSQPRQGRHVAHFAPSGAWISTESIEHYKHFALTGLALLEL